MEGAFARIEADGVVAILRAQSSDRLIAAADALLEGGVSVLEVSLTTPGALEVIQAARSRYAERALFGAGTVLNAETAQAAIDAGAEFIVSPILNPEVVRVCKGLGILIIAGAFTPNEVTAAWHMGLDIVKLFPASLGGPAYLRALLAPLPQVRLMPVGGVTPDMAADYLRAGAVAVGIGSGLVSQAILDAHDFEAIRERAGHLRRAVEAARPQEQP